MRSVAGLMAGGLTGMPEALLAGGSRVMPTSKAAQLATVDPETLDNFVRSCAGYCVISFLLGIA
ncbi:hypothetical protein T484DRAFT_1806524 [Baffinella frigidus]|nr:hypothetical protein T484DRAFT_1806524 [Cryptophyta sp. CCMP2293]